MAIKSIKGHHGDVQFKMIPSLPSNVKKINNVPLAYGEISGHVHVITGDLDLFEMKEKMFAVVGNDGARLQHVMENNLTPNCMMEVRELPIADHKSILLPPGTYEFGIQKQFNPFEEIFQKVLD
jgi:hypothetical protein